MGNDYTKLFQSLPEVSVPVGVSGRVLEAIRCQRERQWRLVWAGALVLAGGSAVGTAVSLQWLVTVSASSGFASYVALLFSDGWVIASHGLSYVFTLLEVLPVLQISLVLALVSLFLGSLRVLSEAYRHRPYINPIAV